MHLKDEGTLCLEGCIHLKEVVIGGGNVHTVTGIGKLCELRLIVLDSMNDLWYTDLEPRNGLNVFIRNCEGYAQNRIHCFNKLILP